MNGVLDFVVDRDLLTPLFGLGAAIAWGVGDFSGGVAARRHDALSVLLAAQIISAIPLAILTLTFESTRLSNQDLFFASLAGGFGMLGIVHLYIGFANGRMSVVAPLAAITASAIPVLFGMLYDGAPGPMQTLGFMIAVLAVWLLTSEGQKLAVSSTEFRFALVSGAGFAALYLCMDRVSGETALWPVLAARIASLSALLGYYATFRSRFRVPARSLLPLIALTGILDTTGNYFFTLAAQSGRVDKAVIVSSLYPAVTVVLALIVLGESLNTKQRAGVLAAVAAILLVAS